MPRALPPADPKYDSPPLPRESAAAVVALLVAVTIAEIVLVARVLL